MQPHDPDLDAPPPDAGDADADGAASGPVVNVRSGRSRAERKASERHEKRERLVEAAIQAELATGAEEATLEQAKRHVLVRLGTIVVGFVVLIGGLVMMILPGPGIVGILAGLGSSRESSPGRSGSWSTSRSGRSSMN